MRRVIIVGNSHTVALKFARQRDGIDVLRIGKEKNGAYIGDVPLDAAISAILHDRHVEEGGALVVSAFGGNHHQMLLLEHEEPFDFYEPGNDSFTAGRTMIPYRALYDTFRGWIVRGKDGPSIQALKKASGETMYHLEGPPPKADENHIRQQVETNFRASVAAGHPFTPAPIRAKLWRLQCAVTKDFCREIGVTYLPVPDGTVTREGFLAPEFYAADATHANAAFGDLVLRQIEALVH